MKRQASIIKLLMVMVIMAMFYPYAHTQDRQLEQTRPGWPLSRNTVKPWTRWWWPGSAVDKQNLTRQLEEFARMGLGGVEITPIYGARGYEQRYIDFLSPEWIDMLEYTCCEARRLGLGVDMATGTGWPFGGPQVSETDANTRIVLRDGTLKGRPTRQRVKRAAPGGEGLVLDPYSSRAIRQYLTKFDTALAPLSRDMIRSQFHDSFEYYNASWSPGLSTVFQQMHGYDIQDYAAELMGEKSMAPDKRARLKCDYRATLAKMHAEYLSVWVEWAHHRGEVTRNQAHGAPGNLLDLYGMVDIPETEIFGNTTFAIPGLNPGEAIQPGRDIPEQLAGRFASSAAHVMGRPLVSCESLTWLGENWTNSLSKAKPELDAIMLDGINHIFYHGTVFSPEDAPWPGWFFYAAVQFNPQNTWWEDSRALNVYLERVQSVLQSSEPDNDLLVYYPVYDVWDDTSNSRGSDHPMRLCSAHRPSWGSDLSIRKTAEVLEDNGYSYDYISDAQLNLTRVSDKMLVTPGSRYAGLIVPPARRMPVSTLKQILDLAEAGATVIFEALPKDVPGLGDLDERRLAMNEQKKRLQYGKVTESSQAQSYSIGKGTVYLLSEAGELSSVLEQLGVTREPIAGHGIDWIRRANSAGHDYFLANLNAESLDDWVSLGCRVQSATILNPLNGNIGVAKVQPGRDGENRIYLQLRPGESLIVRTLSSGESAGQPWLYKAPAGPAMPLGDHTWDIEFIKGGPTIPDKITTRSFADGALRSWTDLGGEAAQSFSGTARYTTTVRLPDSPADTWVLDLGDVRESVRVSVNGRFAGTLWSPPMRIDIGDYVHAGDNELRLDVTNLAANRIRDMDIRNREWKIMRDINIVTRASYEPFDASAWDIQPSGILGPVQLQPMAQSHDPAQLPDNE